MPDPRLDELYREPPDGFVAARDRLAKELRAAGDGDEAARVKKLRRPTIGAWMINRVALEGREQVEEFAAASRALEEAQVRAVEGADQGASGWREAAAREPENRTTYQRQLAFWSERQMEIKEDVVTSHLTDEQKRRRSELRKELKEWERQKPQPPAEEEARGFRRPPRGRAPRAGAGGRREARGGARSAPGAGRGGRAESEGGTQGREAPQGGPRAAAQGAAAANLSLRRRRGGSAPSGSCARGALRERGQHLGREARVGLLDLDRIGVEGARHDDQAVQPELGESREPIRHLVGRPTDRESIDELVLEGVGGGGIALAVPRLLVGRGEVVDALPGHVRKAIGRCALGGEPGEDRRVAAHQVAGAGAIRMHPDVEVGTQREAAVSTAQRIRAGSAPTVKSTRSACRAAASITRGPLAATVSGTFGWSASEIQRIAAVASPNRASSPRRRRWIVASARSSSTTGAGRCPICVTAESPRPIPRTARPPLSS